MARITLPQAKAWLEPTKLQHPSALDADLLVQVEAEILGQLATAFDISTWVDENTTPKIVQTAIAKMYAATFYDRAYSEDVSKADSSYVARLLANSAMIVTGIITGSIIIVELPPGVGGESPIFYPNDNSSIQDPRDNDGADTSLGPAAFSMGQVF